MSFSLLYVCVCVSMLVSQLKKKLVTKIIIPKCFWVCKIVRERENALAAFALFVSIEHFLSFPMFGIQESKVNV